MVTSFCNSFDVFLYFSFSATETKRDYFVLDCLWDHFLPITLISILPIRVHELQKELKFHFKKKWSFPLPISLRIWSHLLKMENLIFCPVFAFLDNYFF